jgi:hypothetical protein
LLRLITLQINENSENLSQTDATEADGVRLAGQDLVAPGEWNYLVSHPPDAIAGSASSPAMSAGLSHPPDGTSPYRVRRLKRCPSSVISYKLMLLLKKLKKSAI